MDVIILAAGRNDRLKGFVPEYMKPLIMVNGSPIIVNIVRDLVDGIATDIIIVVSPHNAGFITAVVEAIPQRYRVRYVVQPEAVGVMDAVRRAMPMVHEDVMIVCADNIIRSSVYEMIEVGLVGTDVSLAVKSMPIAEAQRFTYFDEDDVYEKTSPPDHMKGNVFVWLGPLAIRKAFLFTHADDTERLSGLIALADSVRRVEANCVDIGVPEELP